MFALGRYEKNVYENFKRGKPRILEKYPSKKFSFG